jgi:hypothetical protein
MNSILQKGLNLRPIRPQSNARTRISDKLDAGLLKGAPDFLNRLEVRADGSALQSFQAADRGNCDPGPNREFMLFPSDKRSRCPYLTRNDKHGSVTASHLETKIGKPNNLNARYAFDLAHSLRPRISTR